MSEDHHHRASSSDEVMDTTEGKDFSDGDDLSKAPVDDLFGSGSEVDGDGTQKRRLDDDDLDSGDDEGRQDRMDEDMDGYGEEVETQHSVTMADIELGRHPIPHDNNYETYLLKFPNFVGIHQTRFTNEGFKPPTTDHYASGPPSSTFLASKIAKNTVRWKRSPRNADKIRSNARIIRWSDGSNTMQLASNPMEQYELPAKPLAPAAGAPYDARMDSHTYLATVHQNTSFAQVTNHLTSSLSIQTTTELNDDALIRLQESMAAAVKGNKNTDGGVPIISINEDPEQAKKRAELAEREKLRAQRRRQNQEERERDRQNRVLGRSGLRTGGMSSGLTIGGLEDDDGMAPSKPRTKPTRKPRRRNSEYSDDEDDYRNRGRTREDEYDEDDGFLVGSDEEPELVGNDDDEDEDMGDDDAGGKPKAKKKERKAGEGDGAGGRTKHRRVVDEDEDDD